MENQRTQLPQVEAGEWIEIETPIPQTRALTNRLPLAVMAGGTLTAVVAIWYAIVVGTAGLSATAVLPAAVMQGGAAATQGQPAVSNDTANAPPAIPPLLQSRSAEPTLLVGVRPDGRSALSEAPAALVIYVPADYYPQPESQKPPTTQAAQRTANIVQNMATRNEARAVAQARALRAEQPQYAVKLAQELQNLTLNWTKPEAVRQVLLELDPQLATQTEAQTQTQTQVRTQTTTRLDTQNQTNAPAATAPDRANPVDKANRVYPLVMQTVPAYAKLPFGMNEGTIQANTLVVPTASFLFNQQKIRSALCEIGNSEVVSVHDTIPNGWELKTTFIPKDPVRWFGVKDNDGKTFYLPNYWDASRDMQVGDRFVSRSGCTVELVRK